jgi:hypothetical protein
MTRTKTYNAIQALSRALMIAVLMGAVFAFLGIYDTNNLPFLLRLSFWTVIMVSGALLCFFTEPVIFRILLKGAHPVVQVLAIAFLISIPIMILLMGLNSSFRFDQPPRLWLGQLVNVMIISVIICSGRYIILQIMGRLGVASQDQISTKAPTQAFLERLPMQFRSATLYAISSEGHYLRIHTDKGSPLILMRISDAVKELEQANGLKVHRSWWVAKDGIQDTQKTKGRRSLLLKNGEIAPVSRAHVPALKSANLDR